MSWGRGEHELVKAATARICRGAATIGAALAVTLVLALPASAQQQGTPPAPPPPTPFISTATIDETLEVTGETLAAKQIRERTTVGIMVNGQGPFRFLVDSGADRTVIGAALATKLALPAEDTVILHSMAGTSQVGTVRISELGLGTSRLHDIMAPALPEQFLGAEGVLGIDALAEQRIEFDYDKKTVTVQDTRKPMQGGADEIIVTARLRKGQLILTQVTADRVSLFAIIDSGSDITVANTALRDRIFRRWKNVKTTPVTLMSVTGASFTADVAIIREIHVGGLTLRDVPVAFADPPPFALFGLSKQPALLLGTDVLQVFSRVSLDFHARKVRFRLRNYRWSTENPELHREFIPR
jgi:predicted aspartyl protease